MKLRIKGNTIRYRLTKSDVANFAENKFIQESTNFSVENFSYGMKASDDSDKIGAEYLNNTIMVSIPTALAKHWSESNEVGLSEQVTFPDNKKLFILIEKDFKCLDETSEDQSDNYANPLADKLK